MVQPYQDAKGALRARKRIPSAVQDEYAALYGPRLEAKFFEPATTTPREQRQKFSEWLAEVEGRIASILAARAGEGQSLTARQARALAGEWYRWFVERHPLQDQTKWEALRDRVHDALREVIGDQAWEAAQDPDDLWKQDPEVRKEMRPVLADAGETAQFLNLKALALNREGSALFLDNLYEDLAAALKRLLRHSQGNYSIDRYPERFPAFEGTDSGETPSQLFDRWVDAHKPAAASVESWQYVFRAMANHFAQRSAASISPDEAAEWIKGLIGPTRSAGTVKKTWLNAPKTVFGWAVEHKHVSRNPSAAVKVTVPKRRQHRETKAFRKDE